MEVIIDPPKADFLAHWTSLCSTCGRVRPRREACLASCCRRPSRRIQHYRRRELWYYRRDQAPGIDKPSDQCDCRKVRHQHSETAGWGGQPVQPCCVSNIAAREFFKLHRCNTPGPVRLLFKSVNSSPQAALLIHYVNYLDRSACGLERCLAETELLRPVYRSILASDHFHEAIWRLEYCSQLQGREAECCYTIVIAKRFNLSRDNRFESVGFLCLACRNADQQARQHHQAGCKLFKHGRPFAKFSVSRSSIRQNAERG